MYISGVNNIICQCKFSYAHALAEQGNPAPLSVSMVNNFPVAYKQGT